MAERLLDLLEVMNNDLRIQLDQLRQYEKYTERDRDGITVRLNTIFYLVEKAKLNTTLEVKKEAVIKEKLDFYKKISPKETALYGEEGENSWVFKISSGDPCFLGVQNETIHPRLTYIHKHLGTIANFKPTDIISITLQ